MKTSDPVTDLLTALCAARLEVPTITRNREGFSKRTGQKYQYADLNALIDATEPVLGQHGLVLVQSVDDGAEGTLRITSTLFHASSGQWIASECSVTKPDDMQVFGMVCTYLKRYAQQALLNISTEDDDDAASLNGSSKTQAPKAVTTPLATNNNVHAPASETGESLERPTETHLSALRTLALKTCHELPEVHEQRIRQTMGLKPSASVAPRLLTRTMSMTAYMTVYAYYVKLAEQLARKTPEDTAHGTPSQDAPAAEPTPAPTAEGGPQDPPAASVGESSSAPEVSTDPEADAIERDRVRLRAEVESWDLRVSQDEIEHVILHHPYSKARALLWKCRRQDTAA